MKYVVQAELDPTTGLEVEAQPEKIQQFIEKWQALNPIGFYFHLARRAITVIVDVPNEDAMFEALHYSWTLLEDYPDVSPVASVDEFPEILRRIGVTG